MIDLDITSPKTLEKLAKTSPDLIQLSIQELKLESCRHADTYVELITAGCDMAGSGCDISNSGYLEIAFRFWYMARQLELEYAS